MTTTTETTYRSRYGYSGELPDLVTEDDLAAVETRLANSEVTIPDPARTPGYLMFGPPDQPPRELPGRERWSASTSSTKINSTPDRLRPGPASARDAGVPPRSPPRPSAEHRADRTCRWCGDIVASPNHLGSLTWDDTVHEGVCLEDRAIAYKIIAAQAETPDRVALVLDRLGLQPDQR